MELQSRQASLLNLLHLQNSASPTPSTHMVLLSILNSPPHCKKRMKGIANQMLDTLINGVEKDEQILD